MSLRIDVVRDEIAPELRIMSERMGDFSEPFSVILADGLGAAQETIVEKKAAPGGGPWALMAEATIRKGRDPSTLLIETGEGVLSLSRGGSGNVFEVGPVEGRAGSVLTSKRTGYPYMKGMQEGAFNRPPRPFLAWPEERIPQYGSLILGHIMGEPPSGVVHG
ncbi:MAG: hypothetical protein M3167_06330 [Acidobacteriota bacterium]|nr:hypothetical protein [Acidobacteriota bacterium]MDQ6892281.1 hypothetical protein [Acidobacteriota bacterium]